MGEREEYRKLLILSLGLIFAYNFYVIPKKVGGGTSKFNILYVNLLKMWKMPPAPMLPPVSQLSFVSNHGNVVHV